MSCPSHQQIFLSFSGGVRWSTSCALALPTEPFISASNTWALWSFLLAASALGLRSSHVRCPGHKHARGICTATKLYHFRHQRYEFDSHLHCYFHDDNRCLSVLLSSFSSLVSSLFHERHGHNPYCRSNAHDRDARFTLNPSASARYCIF